GGVVADPGAGPGRRPARPPARRPKRAALARVARRGRARWGARHLLPSDRQAPDRRGGDDPVPGAAAPARLAPPGARPPAGPRAVGGRRTVGPRLLLRGPGLRRRLAR